MISTTPNTPSVVNGRYSCNSSIGLYPKIVVRRERHERHLRKAANVVAAYEQLRTGSRVSVEIDGSTHLAWMVLVGNGAYGVGLLDLAETLEPPLVYESLAERLVILKPA